MHDTSDTEARRYHRRQFGLTLADLAIGALLLVWWICSGAAGRLAAFLEARLDSSAAVVAAHS